MLWLVFLLCQPASAGRGARGQIEDAVQDLGEIKASAGEIPALARLLEKTGWTPTPELSGAFQPGFVFAGGTAGHRLQIEDCFQAPPTRSTYTSAEVVTQLQAGVSVDVGAAGLHAGGSLVKQIKFSTPEHAAIPELKLVPTQACRDMLASAARRGTDLSAMYVVQEVLTAQIAEQTCGKLDAGGRFVAFGAAEASLAMACAQESLEPVAIAYRTVPVLALEGMEGAVPMTAVAPAPAPVGLSVPVALPPPAPVPVTPQPIASGSFGSAEDRDGDGWTDAEDQCPDEYGYQGFGCNVERPYLPRSKDKDQDGVPNASDLCKDQWEDWDGFQDDDGCSDPADSDRDGWDNYSDSCPHEPGSDYGCPVPGDPAPFDLRPLSERLGPPVKKERGGGARRDRDGDGVGDAEDLCPDEPEDYDGFSDADGCPEYDNDQDYVDDLNDLCPNDPEDLDGYADGDGCPDPDNDGDGALDAYDACPFDPEDWDGFEDDDGCAEPDNDGDGVLDASDACPYEPETVNGFEDGDGCPDRAP